MRRAETAGAILLLVLLGIHAAAKVELGLLSEMLWSCNITAILIAVGTLADRRAVTSVAWLTFVVVGLPLWLLDQTAGATTTWPSAAAHVVSPVVGFLYVRRVGLWRYAAPGAFALHLALFALSLLFTPPALNINMAHAAWPPLADWFPNVWAYHAMNLVGLAAALAAGFLVARRIGLVAELEVSGRSMR